MIKHEDKLYFFCLSFYSTSTFKTNFENLFYITSLHMQSHKIIPGVTTDKSFSDKCSIFV